MCFPEDDNREPVQAVSTAMKNNLIVSEVPKMSPLLRSFLVESTLNYGLSQGRNYDVASYPVTAVHGNVDAAGSSRLQPPEEGELQGNFTQPPVHSYRHGAVSMVPKTSWTDDQPGPMWATQVGKEAMTPDLVPSLGAFFGEAFNTETSDPLSSATPVLPSFPKKERVAEGQFRQASGMVESDGPKEDSDDPNQILESFLKSDMMVNPSNSWLAQEEDFPTLDKEASMVPEDFVFDEDLFTDLQASDGYGNRGRSLESPPPSQVLEGSKCVMPLSSSSPAYALDRGTSGLHQGSFPSSSTASSTPHRVQRGGDSSAFLNHTLDSSMGTLASSASLLIDSRSNTTYGREGDSSSSMLSMATESPISSSLESDDEEIIDKFSLNELNALLPPPAKQTKYSSGGILSPSGCATDVAKPHNSAPTRQALSSTGGKSYSSTAAGPSGYGQTAHTVAAPLYSKQQQASFSAQHTKTPSSYVAVQQGQVGAVGSGDGSKYTAAAHASHQHLVHLPTNRPGTPHSDDLTQDDFIVVENRDGTRCIYVADAVQIRVPQDFYLGVTLDRDKLIDMPIDDFNLLLQRAALGDREVAYMKEWRRKGKNKKAAKIARKRKRDEMGDLEVEVDALKNKVAARESERDTIAKELEEMKARAESLERQLLSMCARDTGANALGSKLHHLLISSQLSGLLMAPPRVAQPTQ